MSLPFQIAEIRKVTFYKRDELVTDLICCDVEVISPDGPQTWTNHEESESWTTWIEALHDMHGFDQSWFEKVSQPPFTPSQTVAFKRGR